MTRLSEMARFADPDPDPRLGRCTFCSELADYDSLEACCVCDDMVCQDCQQEHKGQTYCPHCIEKIEEDAGGEI